MQQSTPQTECLSMKPRDVLSDILRQGAQQMLAAAIENEVAEYLAYSGGNIKEKLYGFKTKNRHTERLL